MNKPTKIALTASGEPTFVTKENEQAIANNKDIVLAATCVTIADVFQALGVCVFVC